MRERTSGASPDVGVQITLPNQFFEPFDQINERDAKDAADLAQLQKIETTCAGFIVADEGLRLSQCLCHVNLAETGVGP